MKKWTLIYLLVVGPYCVHAQKINHTTQIKTKEDFDKQYLVFNALLNGDRSDTTYKESLFSASKKMSFWAEKNNDSNRLFQAKMTLLLYYSNQENDIEIIRRATELLRYSNFEKLPESYYVLATLIRAYERYEQFNIVLDLLPQYFKLGEKWQYKGFKKQQIGRQLGNVYYKMGDYNQAKNHYLQQLANTYNQKINSASLSNDIALCYAKLGNFKQATNYYDTAFYMVDSVINSGYSESYTIPYLKHFKNVIYANKLTDIKPLGNKNEIIKALQNQLQTAKKEVERNIILSSYYKLATVLYDKKEYSHSLEYIDSALLELQLYYNPSTYTDALLLKARNLSNLGKLRESDVVFSKYKAYRDSMAFARTTRNREIAAIQFEVSEKEKQLEQSLIELTQKKQLSKMQQMALVSITLLLLSTLIFLYNFYITKKKVQTQLQTIKVILGEKEVLLKEIHHRVKNNLQVVTGLLEIQAAKENNEAFDKLVTDSGRSINAIAMVHQLLYQNKEVGLVDMAVYIKKLCDHNLQLLANDKIAINYSIDKIDLKIEQSIPVGLILNELLSNTYKHAYKESGGIVDISFIKEEENCILTYKDFGKGMTEKHLSSNSESIGFDLITMLAEELEATLEKKNGNGLKYEFRFRQA